RPHGPVRAHTGEHLINRAFCDRCRLQRLALKLLQASFLRAVFESTEWAAIATDLGQSCGACRSSRKPAPRTVTAQRGPWPPGEPERAPSRPVLQPRAASTAPSRKRRRGAARRNRPTSTLPRRHAGLRAVFRRDSSSGLGFL